MSDTFSCPNCGAPLDYKGNDPIIRCPYCSTSVVVPDNLRAKPSFSSKPSNFTLSGAGGDMSGLMQQARRMKEVKDMALAGRTDEAINLYREITNANEYEANAAVQALAEGRPIILSGGMSGAGVSAGSYSGPAIQISTQASKTASRMGCLVGCFTVGLTLFILAVTLIPIFATTLPLALGDQNIPALMTIMPGISTSMPDVVNTLGLPELSFGGEGTGPGLFTDPRAIAVDPQTGNIYVADYQGGRVQAFDPTGKFITLIKVGDKKTIIGSMAIDHKGNLFVATFSNLFKYEAATGKLLGQFKAGDQVGYHFDNVTASADGTLYLIGGGETIVHMDSSGKILTTVPKSVSSITDDTEAIAKIAVDGEGNIYVLGTLNDAVFKFNPDGKYINKFGSDGDDQGQFRAPDAIAVDGKGNIYVSDFKGIQIFDNDGRYLRVIDVQGAVFGMVFDDQGKLYVTTNVNKILKFNVSQ